MTDFHDFRGVAKPIDDIDIPRIGYRIKVGEDEIHAVMDVEAAGGAWDKQGRPKMLFEPHRFYRNLGAGEGRDRAVTAGLAYPTWGEKPYPADSYARLVQAMAIDETAALKSASWGLGQILGENFAMLGYDTPQAMVLAFLDDAETHLEGMVSFVLAAKLDDELRAHKWSAFARGYNGPQYAKNGYDRRLRQRFEWWQGKTDTAWSPATPVPAPQPAAPAPIGHNGGPPLDAAPVIAAPVPTPIAQGLSPIEQMNKPVKGAQANLAAGGVGAAALLLFNALGIMPVGWQTPDAQLAIGIVVPWGLSALANFVASYRARDKRFQPQPAGSA